MSEPIADVTETSQEESQRTWAPLLSGLGSMALLTVAAAPLALLSAPELRARLAEAPPGLSPAVAEATALAAEPLLPVPATPFSAPSFSLAPGSLPPGMGTSERGSVAGIMARQTGRASGRPGGLGPIGPIQGPLNAQVALGGPVRGPVWNQMPLPGVGRNASGPLPVVPAVAFTPEAPAVPAHAADNSSEIPDAQRIALSRLANPELEVRAVKPRTGGQASAEKPLRLSVSVARPAGGYETGDTVTVHVSANMDCYAALIQVDTAGRASTVFRSPGSSRGFSCAVKAGPGAGAEYLVAVGSVHPLNGGEASAALRGSGGFPAVSTGEGGLASGAAWSLAVSQAASLGGPARSWQRYEWAVDSAAFSTRAAVRVAENRAAERRLAQKPPLRKSPVEAEVSILPGEPTPPTLDPGKPAARSEAEPETRAVRSAPEPAREPSVMPTLETVPASGTMGGEKTMLPPTTRRMK